MVACAGLIINQHAHCWLVSSGPALADPMDPAVVTLSAQLSRLWGLPSLHLLGGVGMPTYRVTQRNHGQGLRFLALKNRRGNKVKPQLISCKGEIAVAAL